MLLPELDGRGEVLEVDLVHDAHARRDHPEIVEGALGELQQLVALGVPVEFKGHVEPERVGGAVVVHLDRVVDDEITGDDRVDPVRVAAHLGHRVAHGGEVHHAGHASKVLQDDPSGHEGDFRAVGLLRLPGRKLPDVVLGHDALSAPAEGVFQEHPD